MQNYENNLYQREKCGENFYSKEDLAKHNTVVVYTN